MKERRPLDTDADKAFRIPPLPLRRLIRTIFRPTRLKKKYVCSPPGSGREKSGCEIKERSESHPGFWRPSALSATLFQGNLDLFLLITSRLAVSYFKLPSLPLHLAIPGSLFFFSMSILFGLSSAIITPSNSHLLHWK